MTWAEYATLASQLEEHRSKQATKAACQADARSMLAAELVALEALLATQRLRIADLCNKLDLSYPVLTGQPAEVADLHEALRRARDAAERSASQLTTVELAAKHSPLLPHWSVRLRNSLVYGCASGSAFLLSFLVLFGVSSGTGQILVLFLFVTLPFLAYGIGSFLIGLLFTPALGSKPSKTRSIGLAICLAPILPLCALWGVFWSAKGS
jgi:hypothetical protein